MTERFFNTAGPNKPEIEYTIPPLSRFDLDDILMLIRQNKYFVLHAPRQTGKTSYLLALRNYLNQKGNHKAVYVNVEAGQAARNDVQRVIHAVIDAITLEYRLLEGDHLADKIRDAV